jgi:hypothetical protein
MTRKPRAAAPKAPSFEQLGSKQHRASPVFYTNWLPWYDACQRAFACTSALAPAFAEMARLLKAREIQSAVSTTDPRTRKTQIVGVPPEFWNEIGMQSAQQLQTRVAKWVKKKRVEATLPNWWPEGSFHYFYPNRNDVDRHWPAMGEAGTVNVVNTDRRKPGPKPRHDWPLEMAAELIMRISKNGGHLPKNDQRLAKDLLELCYERWQWEPPDSEMRSLISRLLGPARNSG